MSAPDISSLIAQLGRLNSSTPVFLKETNGGKTLEAAGLLGRLGGSQEGHEALVRFICQAVFNESGAAAADKAGQLLSMALKSGDRLSAGMCIDVLRKFATSGSASAEVLSFVEEFGEARLRPTRFFALAPPMQLAAMHGVRNGLEMMKAISELADADDGSLKPDSLRLSLESVQKVQKELARRILGWAKTIEEPMPPERLAADLPAVIDAVGRIFLIVNSELLSAFFDVITRGAVADILGVQFYLVKTLDLFAEDSPLPSGFDAKTPARAFGMLRRMMFGSACLMVRQKSGLTNDEQVRSEVKLLLSPDVRSCMGRLLRLYVNGLLRDMPDKKELRPRASVRGFDAEGIHADFVRDCIARRCSFSIAGRGKMDNSIERELAYARGKKDLAFYEQKMAEHEQSGKKESPAWEKPQVRSSAAMTEEDLKKSREFFMLEVPGLDQRMAVSAISNLSAIALPGLFFTREPLAGIMLSSGSKQMRIDYSPRTSRLSIDATILHDSLRSLERHGDGDDEIKLAKMSCTQINCSLVLQADPHPGKRGESVWTISQVSVESISTSLFAESGVVEEAKADSQ